MKLFIVSIVLTVLTSCGGGGSSDSEPEKAATLLNGVEVSTFIYQLQKLFKTESVDLLDATEYDMLVVEPGFNFTVYPYKTEYMVTQLKTKPNGDERILLAYIDIGQAEDYRDNWLANQASSTDNWQVPTLGNPGNPEFIVSTYPDGWEGNFPVAYWDPDWRKLWNGNNGIIQKIADFGFDGIYLDRVEAYDDDDIIARAATDGVDPAFEMMEFIQAMKTKGQVVKSDFLVVAQNASYLLDFNPERYASIISALATEDTWFYGEGDVPWDDADAGDLVRRRQA
jgi:cysteinyl-tRNA synthetase